MSNVDFHRCLSVIPALVPGMAIAADPGSNVVSSLATLGKLGMALIVVLLVFWVFARVMKRIQAVPGGMNNSLSCIGSLNLGQRERVVVVQAGDQQLVLGVTASQINTLHVLDSPLPTGPARENTDFRQKLSIALKGQVTS